MNDSQVTKDKLVSDFKAVVADTEELLKLTAGQAGDKVADVRVRLNDKLTAAKYKLQDLEAAVVHGHQGAAAHSLARPLDEVDAAALRQDLPLRVVQHLAVLGLHGEAALGQPGLVQGAPGLGIGGRKLNDTER